MPPKKAGGSKAGKGAKGDDSGEKGENPTGVWVDVLINGGMLQARRKKGAPQSRCGTSCARSRASVWRHWRS